MVQIGQSISYFCMRNIKKLIKIGNKYPFDIYMINHYHLNKHWSDGDIQQKWFKKKTQNRRLVEKILCFMPFAIKPKCASPSFLSNSLLLLHTISINIWLFWHRIRCASFNGFRANVQQPRADIEYDIKKRYCNNRYVSYSYRKYSLLQFYRKFAYLFLINLRCVFKNV